MLGKNWASELCLLSSAEKPHLNPVTTQFSLNIAKISLKEYRRLKTPNNNLALDVQIPTEKCKKYEKARQLTVIPCNGNGVHKAPNNSKE
jgi:hypothetical protein